VRFASGLPIVFVTTDALNGSALVFRKHQLRMGKRPPAWEYGSPQELRSANRVRPGGSGSDPGHAHVTARGAARSPPR
jgi:hypothetical protein